MCVRASPPRPPRQLVDLDGDRGVILCLTGVVVSDPDDPFNARFLIDHEP